MNLHQIVRHHISSVNPEKTVTIRRFSGSRIGDTGLVKNSYENYNPDMGQALEFTIRAQVQPLSSEDLEHVYNLNSSNTYRKMFINGKERGLSQALNTNGDLVLMDGETWIICEVPGLWDESGWNEVILCLQNVSESEYSKIEEEERMFNEIPVVIG